MQFKKILTKKVLIILLLILAQSAGVSKVWGQEFEGIWYIDNDANHNLTPDNRWYLVPAKDSKQAKGVDAYYSPNYATTDGDPEKPFLTTYQTNKDANSIWFIVSTSTPGYYNVIHALTGKYVIYEVPLPNDPNKNNDADETKNGRRKTMHLQTIDNGTYSLSNSNFNFAITGSVSTGINIRPQGRAGWYWNPAGNNHPYYSGQNGSLYTNGMVGVYNNNSANSIWHLESTKLPAPTIDYNASSGSYKITTEFTNFDIRYTTDGTTPTIDSPIYDGSTIIVEHDATTVKAIITGMGKVLSEQALCVVNTASPQAPEFEVTCDSKLQINSNISSAKLYYTYTTDGSTPADPSNASTEWNEPVTMPDGAKIKAIAYNGIHPSTISEVYTFKNRTATPVINLSGTTATITFAEGTLYYTTNGTDPVIGDENVKTSTVSPVNLTVLENANIDIRALAKVEGREQSCPITIAKRPKKPIISMKSECGGTIRTHTLTLSGTQSNKTYWYALTNGSGTSAPALSSFLQYTPGQPVEISTIPTWDRTSTYVTLHAYAKDAEGNVSVVTSQNYLLKYTEVPTITHTVNASNTTVNITSTSGAQIHYSVDNGEILTATTSVSLTVDNINKHTIIATAKKGEEGESCEAIHTISFGHKITTLEELRNIDLDEDYILGGDIDVSGSYTTIGTDESPFRGSFDGAGYTISGLSQPLFGTTDGAVIHDINLKQISISKSGNVGAIVCDAKGYTRIYNCGILPTTPNYPQGVHSTVTATGSGCAGSIVGKLEDDSRVVNCFSYADVISSGVAAGIVGNNAYYTNTSTGVGSTAREVNGKYTELRTMIVNCMFYGNITASSIYPVYGGAKIINTGVNAINNYNYYCVDCKFSGTLTDYNCSWPAQKDYLTRYEFHRNLLNSNRELCGWWVGSRTAPAGLIASAVQAIPKDASIIRKWVLDPSVAPYPILKSFGFYNSPINIDDDAEWRITANEWEGKNLGTISVTINPGAHAAGNVRIKYNVPFIITDMDTLHTDYCYRKIQLPYYNKVFGNPNGTSWAEKYGGNYTEYVVTGWDITRTNGTEGTITEHWENGYDFADRKSSAKDKKRVFAQGGFYYVPDDVTAITITAHWGTAVYLDNTEHSYDRVNMSGSNQGTHFAPAGYRNATLGNGKESKSGTISSAIPNNGGVYEDAIVLVGNHQYRNGGIDVVGSNGTSGCTITSADFDFDNEPDHCLIWQLGLGTTRQSICPIRFDFLPIEEMGLAMKEDNSTQYYSLGCYRPLGHFEVTETALIHFGQFEFGNEHRSTYAPIILNGGIFDQYTKGTKAGGSDDKINYIILGGNVRMPSFTPGAHVNSAKATRHCAVNVIGGSIDYLYLTGNYNEGITPNSDNPHCYIDGGKFKQIAAAGKEGIDGDVYFNINHSNIQEFYGGSTLANQLVTGNINVNIDNSIVEKYCGGPKFGNMNLNDTDPSKNKTVTTTANNTQFGVYYGGGNGGTSYVQYDKSDGEQTMSSYSWETTGKLNNYTPCTYRGNKKLGYMADYDMEIVNVSSGTNPGRAVCRTYFYAAQFSATNTGSISNSLTNCKILKNFYGGGNLGGVIGNVTSTLTDTEIFGSAFGAGFSASVPNVTIHNKNKQKPTIDLKTGIITPTPISGGASHTYTTYTWTNNPALSTSNPVSSDGKYLFTEESLENLGTVTGDVMLTINGSTHVYGKLYDENDVEISERIDKGGVFGGGDASNVIGNTQVTMSDGTVDGSVFGGANQAIVNGNTNVEVSGGIIGKPNAPKYAALVGNVYGGGKGNESNVKSGLVTGDTHIKITGDATSPFIYHNIYGGGAYGSVGVYTYADAAYHAQHPQVPIDMPISHVSGGITYVSIEGGVIGTTGHNNGMVNGSSRGEVTVPVDGFDHNDVLGWSYDTHVTIGDSLAGTNQGGTGKKVDYPLIKGSVYGSGENGHTFHNTEVKVHSGTIGIESGEEITSNGIKYFGPRYPFRGNVYGGGCGTDTYTLTGSDNKIKTYYNFNAGLVKGNSNVVIDGGHIIHNVYGGGAMGAIGTFNSFADEAYVAEKKADYKDVVIGMPIDCEAGTGKCTVTISGGDIGTSAMHMEAGGGPDDFGHVFGAGRGDAKDPEEYPNVETCAFYGSTEVTIKGTALVRGGVYGGSESGHVVHDALVKIEGGQVGCGEGLTEAYTEQEWQSESPTIKPTNHWTYIDDGAPYDQYADENGNYANNVSSQGGNRKATDGHSFYGNVFAGGSGYYPYAQGKWLFSAGRVAGNAKVIITGGHILNNVYGGCEMSDIWGDATIEMSGGTVGIPRTKQEILYNPTFGHIFGAGMGDKRIFFNQTTNVENSNVSISGGRIYGSVYGGGEDGHVLNKATTTISGNVVIGTEQQDGSTTGYDGNVFGAGQGSPTAITAGSVGGNTILNIEGGTMLGSVYGGGRIASVGILFEKTTIPDPNDITKQIPNPLYGKMQDGDDHGYITVNLKKGTIRHNVYGGCMGTRGLTGVEQTKFAISKNVTVKLNEDVEDTDNGCVVLGDIYGCNNVNSSPQEDVTVHIYKTQNAAATQIAGTVLGENATQPKTAGRYDVHAVYGGGNMAAYQPKGTSTNGNNNSGKDTQYSTKVIIDGCDRTSIQQVYGGGNAASTPATEVIVNGTYEIDELFGGGNGADRITYDEGTTWLDNPGANVGFYDYSAEEDIYNTKEKRTTDAVISDTFKEKYVYGTGKASVNIYGGMLHHVFGGSNTKGNVRVTALTLLEEKKNGTDENNDEPICPFRVDDVYGGGKSALMDAEAKLYMSCIPGLRAAYGGAEAADVLGGVTLNITNGRFDRVFGGNNKSGTIRGSIEVNIEETGCRPIIIGELYGGGNEAGYSVYGYKKVGDSWVGREQADGLEPGMNEPYRAPVVNVKSFTSIGNIYGGGYGPTAVMVGDPTVNINVAVGSKANHSEANVEENAKSYDDEQGYPIPSHEPGKIGAINNVFGGGNLAKVIGQPQVNIGTLSYEYMLVNEEIVVGVTDVSNFYTRSGGEGTLDSPYIYSKCATGSKAQANTNYYIQHEVIGADIRGNVYGGGNHAEVTGNTAVTIGKKEGE